MKKYDHCDFKKQIIERVQQLLQEKKLKGKGRAIGEKNFKLEDQQRMQQKSDQKIDLGGGILREGRRMHTIKEKVPQNYL